MNAGFLMVGEHLFNLDAIAGVHWESAKLFVHFVGGRFVSFSGDEAKDVWRLLQEHLSVIPLATAASAEN